MGRLQLTPNPTFSEKVEIPVPGQPAAKVEFTFKHRTRAELEAFLNELPELDDDVALIKKVATGWELVDDFSDENIRALVQNYVAAPARIVEAYLAALSGAKRKN